MCVYGDEEAKFTRRSAVFLAHSADELRTKKVEQTWNMSCYNSHVLDVLPALTWDEQIFFG